MLQVLRFKAWPAAIRAGREGFTLIEMAIVVALFGLMAGGGLLGVSVWMEKEAIKTTHDRLERIERSITLYVIRTGCLPCPYNPAVATPGTVLTSCGDNLTGVDSGLVPYRELGLARTDVVDGWNRYIDFNTYSAFSDDDGNCTAQLLWSSGSIAGLSSYTTSPDDGAPADGSTQLNGLIRIMDSSETAPGDDVPLTNAATAMAVRAVYTLVSHGRNGFGAYVNYRVGNTRNTMPATNANTSSAGEVENADNDLDFASEALVGVTDTGAFDDIVRGRTAAQIIQDAQ